MKVFIIGPAYPFRGGIANFSETLCNAFINSGCDASVINFTLQYPNFLFPGKTQFTESPPHCDIEIVRMISSVNPLTWIKTGLYIKKQKPDVVVFNYWMPFFAPTFGTVSRIFKRNNHTKVVAVCHNILPHEKRIGDKLFTRFFIKSCDAFVTLSDTVKSELLSISPQAKVKVIPHPVYNIFGERVERDIAIKKLGLNHAERYILFFGVVRKYKGLDTLIEAFSNSILKNNMIKLIVAGEFYENVDDYIEMIKEKGLENKITIFNKFIPSEEVKYYFSACDLVAQTYKNASQSGVTQIANHFEKPMLVTNVGGLSEIVLHLKTGYVTSQKPEDIAGFIYDFYENNRAVEFHPNLVKEKGKYSWQNMVDGIIDFIR